MNDTARQILTAVAAATAATLVTGLLTHYLTKRSTIADVAKGSEPLPAGATPTTMGNGSSPKPPPTLAPLPSNEQLAHMAQAVSTWQHAIQQQVNQ